MNANEITFGIEFETTLPLDDRTPVGMYHHGLQVEWLPEGWKAELDGSIRTAPLGGAWHGLGSRPATRKACEFVSPKLKGSDGLYQVMGALNEIRSRGAQVNESCGLHITVEWNGDAAALARLISLVANHEKALYASTGTRRREDPQHCRFCKSVKQYGSKEHAKQRCDSDRYHALNLTHLARGQNRIEFRLFAGTVNTEKVVGYIMMVLGLVELALNTQRCADWIATESGKNYWDHQDAGKGERELARLFYRLNWNRGTYKSAHRFHNRVFGKLEMIADLSNVKKRLTEMARKYDRS